MPWEDRSIGHAVAMAYYYCLDSPRFIRYIRLITADSIKNINIYVWEGENWTMVRQLKTPVDAQTRIDINRRSNGIRVVQKTMKAQQRDHVTDFEVYVRKK